MNPRYSIQISTRNRVSDLLETLGKLRTLLSRADVECLVFDDGSTDETAARVKDAFPTVTTFTNETTKGYLYCRNYMLNHTTADIAITLDDDSCFVDDDPLEAISQVFAADDAIAVLAFRVFWGKQLPDAIASDETARQVRGFVGCGHAWRISAWKQIDDYPEWFGFYGEETFATLALTRSGFKIVYLPSVLVHHRVDMAVRKAASDFAWRYRRSLRADWYLYFLFFPKGKAVRFFLHSIRKQVAKAIRKPSLLKPIAQAFFDLASHAFVIRRQRRSLSDRQFQSYMSLPMAPIYWKPS